MNQAAALTLAVRTPPGLSSMVWISPWLASAVVMGSIDRCMPHAPRRPDK